MGNTLLEGNLASISFPNLVQLIKMESKTALLELHRIEVNQHAEMYFQNGSLKYAAVNALRGEDAMFRIICWWNTGDFKVVSCNVDEVPTPNVSRQIDWILLEGMRRMDECKPFKDLLPDLTSAVSFTQEALDAFEWDKADPPEWIPHWMRYLPRSFSMAKLFEVSTLGHKETCDALKSMLYTQGTMAHASDGALDPAHAPIQKTRFDSFALICMEVMGYEAARQLVESTLAEMPNPDLDALGFSQMVDFADRLSLAVSRQVGFDQGQDINRKLRARITSLL
ncbi:MAG: DUF4388 domain-containing protein [Candidatus Sericytochromatia bacterium]|nr:DUF4388 domain-containing protein [Candidatus Sericytochromatia bacterium]